MKRYQKLIQTATETTNLNQLSIIIEAPKTSIYEWATHGYKVPQFKSLEKIAAHFHVPVSTLLMEADSPLIAIVDALYKADQQQLNAVAFLLDIKQ
jgi:LysM repeat protein